MKSRRHMRFRYFFFKIKYACLAILQIPFAFAKYERLHRHRLGDEQYFYIYWLFDELYNAVDINNVEVYRSNYETMVCIDDRYILLIWNQNAPYCDMKLAIYQKDPNEKISCHKSHFFEDLPPYYIGCKMRAFDQKIQKSFHDLEKIPFYSQLSHRVVDPTKITTDLLKDVLAAKKLETL